jgi:hypothetical protein
VDAFIVIHAGSTVMRVTGRFEGRRIRSSPC